MVQQPTESVIFTFPMTDPWDERYIYLLLIFTENVSNNIPYMDPMGLVHFRSLENIPKVLTIGYYKTGFHSLKYSLNPPHYDHAVCKTEIVQILRVLSS